MYFKAESGGVASYAQPTVDSGGSSPCEETGKLKSVVWVVGGEKRGESTECRTAKAETAVVEDMETVGGTTAGEDSEGDGVKGEGGEP